MLARCAPQALLWLAMATGPGTKLREKRLREGAYEARVQIECAQAVGTKKTHARGASNLYQFSRCAATVLVAFGEPGREDNDHLHALRAQARTASSTALAGKATIARLTSFGMSSTDE